MKRLILRARIKDRSSTWTEEYSVLVRDDMTPMEYGISVVNNFNQRQKPMELARECLQVRELSKLTMNMEHDWVRSCMAKKNKADRFICKRCGWTGSRLPDKVKINCDSNFSRTPNICNWHI